MASANTKLDWIALPLLGALQGVALYALVEHWPDAGTAGFARFEGAAFFVLASGLVLHLARSGNAWLRLVLLAAGTGGVFGAIAAWVAAQVPAPGGASEWAGDGTRLFTWTLASVAALCVLGPFLQIYQATERLSFPYAELHRLSWRNAFGVSLGIALAGVLVLVLWLWGLLFDLVGVEAFAELFSKPGFLYPAIGAAFAYALAVMRERSSALDTIVGITQSLFRVLLPLVAVVSFSFLAVLPVTGLAELYEGDSTGAVLRAWLIAALLFFNAVYQDGASAPPYGTWLRRFVEAGAFAFAGIAALALWATWLRVEQYGLTPQRVWALVSAALLGCYWAGYAAAVLLRGEPWVPWVRRVNVALSLVVVALAFALHTPLADPLGLSLRNQLARLESGRVSWEDFDFALLDKSLGRDGRAALDALAVRAPDEGVAEKISAILGGEDRRGVLRTDFTLVPDNREWPEGVFETIRADTGPTYWISACRQVRCFLIAEDVTGDGEREEIVYSAGARQFAAFSRVDASGAWQLVAIAEASAAGDLIEKLENGDVSSAPSQHRDLIIGVQRIEFDFSLGSPGHR